MEISAGIYGRIFVFVLSLECDYV